MKPVLSPTTTTANFHHQHHIFSPFFFSSLPSFSKRRRRRPIMAACTTAAPATVSSSGVQQHNHHHRHQRKKDKMVIIMGATGTGKSRLSIDLATIFSPCEIVNSDKMQVYKGLDITTNKIAFHDRGDVPHHFLGEFDTDEVGELSPSEFRERAELTVSDIISRKRTPFLVGGSNSFVYSLLVEEYDPDSDVFNGLVNSNSVSSELRYDCCFLWVDSSLPVLYEYLDKRVDDMLDLGMFRELAEFFDSDELDRDPEIRAGLRKAIGVPEFQRYFKKYPPGKYKGLDRAHGGAYEEAVREIKENTRQLAKRQIGKIMRLRRAGWDLRRLDATSTFRLLLMDGSDDNDSDWRSVWERQILEPSVKIVKRFLEG
ncbi:hypothetical protein Ddye_029981 [Dipteronia dyeriana]|uniref:Adenylate isopentenyltransferase n=1 Tax=Dipteronia dyeriana TaxID=168575 RepID=A0AAD9WL31_9ROSI|nr:hypothetical protein Ddye_029981 [Dipteronia dyeriana]